MNAQDTIGRVDVAVERLAARAVSRLEQNLGIGALPLLSILARPVVADFAQRAAEHPFGRKLSELARKGRS